MKMFSIDLFPFAKICVIYLNWNSHEEEKSFQVRPSGESRFPVRHHQNCLYMLESVHEPLMDFFLCLFVSQWGTCKPFINGALTLSWTHRRVNRKQRRFYTRCLFLYNPNRSAMRWMTQKCVCVECLWEVWVCECVFVCLCVREHLHNRVGHRENECLCVCVCIHVSVCGRWDRIVRVTEQRSWVTENRNYVSLCSLSLPLSHTQVNIILLGFLTSDRSRLMAHCCHLLVISRIHFMPL